jgi:acyl-CoA synthetase (NDP forming)
MEMPLRKLTHDFFYPKSVAIFGESEKRRFFWIHSLINNGFDGAIYPIHPKRESGAGLKFYKSVFDIPGSIDYAIIAVPAVYVLDCLKDCVKKGIKFASIFASGFSEIGDKGNILEAAIQDFIVQNDLRVNGPNCMGVYCPKSGLAFRTDSKQIMIGTTSFVSQSGGIAINLILRGQKQALYFSKVISTGNGIDLPPADYIEFLADDPETKVIGAYLENLGKNLEDARHLLSALKYANQKKPVVVWRGGRTVMGAKAASSHTGALATDNTIWNALVKQTGIIDVRTFEELVDTLLAFQIVKPKSRPKGPAVGLVSVSGGVGVTNSDLLADIGLTVPKLSQESIDFIEKDNMVASIGVSPQNPIDLGSTYFALGVVDKVIQRLVADTNVDSVIIEISSHYVYNVALLSMPDYPRLFMEQIEKTIKKSRQIIKDKPILLTIPNIAYEEERLVDRAFFTGKNIPVFDTVESAGKAINNLRRYHLFMENLPKRYPNLLNIES